MKDSENKNENQKSWFGFKRKKNRQRKIDNDWDTHEDSEEQDLYINEQPHKKKKNHQYESVSHIDGSYPEDDIYKKRKFYDKDKPKNTFVRTMFQVLFILIMFVVIIIIVLSSQSKRPYNSVYTPETPNNTIPYDNKKLETPVIGTIDTGDADTVKDNKSDIITHIDFDYSPLRGNNISDTPMLPNKIQNKESFEINEFQDLWENGTQNQEKSIDIEQKTSQQALLPAWRRYAVDYNATKGFPNFTIILDYRDKKLSVDNLPKYKGYNAVITGFTENAQENLNLLRDNKIEVLLYLPMQEKTERLNLNPIKISNSFDDIRESVTFHTSQLNGSGFVGFMNYGGKEVKQDIPKINFTMSVLAETGYLYVDDNHDNERSYAFATAESHKIPTLKTKTYIKSVASEFETFITNVQNNKTGIAIIEATDENIKYLDAYDDILKKRQISRIPISGILKNKMLID